MSEIKGILIGTSIGLYFATGMGIANFNYEDYKDSNLSGLNFLSDILLWPSLLLEEIYISYKTSNTRE